MKLSSRQIISKRANDQLHLPFGEDRAVAEALARTNLEQYFVQGYADNPNYDDITEAVLDAMTRGEMGNYLAFLQKGYLQKPKYQQKTLQYLQNVLSEESASDAVEFLENNWRLFDKSLPQENLKQVVNNALGEILEEDIISFWRVAEMWGMPVSSELLDEGRAKAFDIAQDNPVGYFEDYHLYMFSEHLHDITDDAIINIARDYPSTYYDMLSGNFEDYLDHNTYAFEIMCRNWASDRPDTFFTTLYEDKEEFKEMGLNIPDDAIIEAGEWIAKTKPEAYVEQELHLIPELNGITRELGLQGAYLPKELSDKGYSLTEDMDNENYASIHSSAHPDQQRHPRAKHLQRFDFAVNFALNNKLQAVHENVSVDYNSDIHDIGTDATKSFALIALDAETKSLIVEEIQSDFPTVLFKMNRDNHYERARREGISKEDHSEYKRIMSEHLAAYPYIVMQKLAEFAAQNENIDKIKLTDFNTIVEMAGVDNQRKADKIYAQMPTELGFKSDRASGFMVYDGDMNSLATKAKQKAEEVVSKLYQKSKPVSSRQAPTRRDLDVDAVKPAIQSILGDKVEQLDFSGDVASLMRSVSQLSKEREITRSQQKQIAALMNKYIRAFLSAMITKVAEMYGIRNYISKRAKVQSDKPAYKEKKKTDKGYVWVYDDKHVEKRWKEKKEKLKKLEKELEKVRKKYREDLRSDDDRTKAIAAIIGIMDDTAMRIGNEESAKEGTYGASTLKVEHVKGSGSKITFDFPGKGAVEQHVELKDKSVIKAVRDLMKGKKKKDFIFEVDGKKIWDRAVNRYLSSFDISAKDLRGFHANRLMKEMLKKKNFNDALNEVAEIVGHEASTLKNQYLDPELVEKHEGKEKKATISIRADKRKQWGFEQVQQSDLGGPDMASRPAPEELEPNVGPKSLYPSSYKNVSNIDTKTTPRGFENIKITPEVARAWRLVAPFLPEGSYISSGFRSEWDQIFTIKNKWDRYKGYFQKAFPGRGKEWKDQWQVMVREYPQKLRDGSAPPGGPHPKSVLVDWPGESAHQKKEGFDVSGSDLAGIGKSLAWLNKNMPYYFSISYDVKPDHVHVQIDNASSPPPKTLRQALNAFWSGKDINPSEVFVSKSSISKRADLLPEHKKWIDSIKPSGPSTSGSGLLVSEPGTMSKEERQEAKISGGVKTTKLIEDAWRTISPFLPRGARLTSGVRGPVGQLRTLNNYWRRATKQSLPPELLDESIEGIRRNYKQLRQVSRQLKQIGYIVGPPTPPELYKATHGHARGNAMDISGADLNEIASVVRWVGRNQKLPVNIKGVLVEPKNNAVHVNIDSAQYDPQAIAQVKRELGFRVASPESARLVKALHEGLVEDDAPEEMISNFEEIFGLNHPEMGFGLEDEMGDWFEKSPMFLDRREKPEHDIHDLSESESKKIADEDPESFFYRGLHKEFPEHESVALKNMLEDNAKFYFVFKYHEREEEEFKELLEDAAEALSQQDARAFFYYHLHHKFPELGRGAIIQIVDNNPDSFFDLGLDKDYPDYVESANNARNIKDPNKVELELPEWIQNDPEKPISLRDRNASRPLSARAAQDKQKAGVFSVLPKSLAKQFSSLGEYDDSDTHLTVLYIGEVSEDKFETLEGIIRDVAKNWKPFEVSLDDKVSYFPATKHSDGCKIAKMSVVSDELKKFNKALKKALIESNMDFANHFPTYKPHVTLEYMEPPKDRFDGKVPSGKWKIDTVQIWGCGRVREIKLGKNLSKRAK